MADAFFQKRRRLRGVWFAPPLFLLVYLLLFPIPSGRESYVRPVWSVPLSSADPAGSAEPFPFRAGDLFGYATVQGGVLHLEPVAFGVALASTGFINYGQVPDHFVFMDPLGRMRFSVASSGYPLLAEDGQSLYALASDLGGIRRLSDEGEPIWSLGFASQITGVALGAGQCVLGLMEGHLVCVGSAGEVLYEYEPSGSRIPVILGVAVTPQGSPIAAVSGIDPQRLLLIERSGAEYTPRLALELGTDFRREVLLRFTEDGRFLYVEGDDALRVLDVRRHRLMAVALPGRVRAFAGGGSLTAVALEAPSGSRLVVLRPLRAVLCEQTLGEARPFLKLLGETLIIGLEGYLLRADIVHG